MNHDPAPEVTVGGLRGLAQRFARWRHFREWEYGECRGERARRNRRTGEVQFVMWPKGYVVRRESVHMPDYIYPADWWINFDRSWWPEFRGATKQNL